MKIQILQIVNDSINEYNVNLSIANRKLIDYIINPLEFYSSKPGNYNEASDNNNGETKWQRELYTNESIWYDMELPIGQTIKNSTNKRASSKRIDLIGLRMENTFSVN